MTITEFESTFGIELIRRERIRQIEIEGFTPEKDVKNREKGEMLTAAACYLLANNNEFVIKNWPFDFHWWKPSTSKNNLIKAGALIAAELDLMHSIQSPVRITPGGQLQSQPQYDIKGPLIEIFEIILKGLKD